jgi:A/G-specific adenine glycosylase
MLQQTQVATVVPYFNEWMRRFPDFRALAAASETDVLLAWQGLGYYARARNLRATAVAIEERHGGAFPETVESIRELPGVGRYTANAVVTFAFDQSVPIVEANIARVLSRLFDLQTPIDTSLGLEQLWSYAAGLLPKTNARLHNSALMELGALVCTAQPRCLSCPVKAACRTTQPAALPRKKPRRALVRLTEHHSFARRGETVLLEKSSGRWRGMWTLPQCSEPTGPALHRSEFPFTHHRIALAVHGANGPIPKRHASQRWFRISELASVPLPSPHRRALNDLLAAAPAGVS